MNQLLTELHPAVAQALQQHALVYKIIECDPAFADTAAFCEHYKIAAEQTCNAILGASKTDPIKYSCCVILSTCKLDVNKKLCHLLGVKRCSFASAELTLALTHMEIGGVTPVGITDMPIFIDSAIMSVQEIVLGGGNRSSKLLIAPSELTKLPNVQVVESLGISR
jgi:prolyl-tRNA editing enzyme YbaK/EbsC (Cys-tRNA(Pro) deacylase)